MPSSFINKLYSSISRGLPSAEPVPALRIDESELVQGGLQMLQGFSSSLFVWDDESRCFLVKSGIYVPHLSQNSLYALLEKILCSATCLKLVELFVKKVEALREGSATLRAFSGSVSSLLMALRASALKEEVKAGSNNERMTTLIGLGNFLSSISSGAEYLLQIVLGSVPNAGVDFEISIPAAELAVHILDNLFLKLNQACLVQGGEDVAYHMLLTIFTASLLPYLEELDSWLYDGTLDDPYHELFFYSNELISVDQSEFWEKRYLLRSGGFDNSSYNEKYKKPSLSSLKGADCNDKDTVLCPLFFKGIARAIISAGKSLQLVRHVWNDLSSRFIEGSDPVLGLSRTLQYSHTVNSQNMKQEAEYDLEYYYHTASENEAYQPDDVSDISSSELQKISFCPGVRILSLSELFLISLVGLVGDRTRICTCFPDAILSLIGVPITCKLNEENHELGKGDSEPAYKGIWSKFAADTIIRQRGYQCISKASVMNDAIGKNSSLLAAEMHDTAKDCRRRWFVSDAFGKDRVNTLSAFYPEHPAIDVCRDFLFENTTLWDNLSLPRNLHLPPLNDDTLRGAIFGEYIANANNISSGLSITTTPRWNGTSFSIGYKSHQFGEFQMHNGTESLKALYPFPTLLPCLQENHPVSESISFQKNGTLASKVLSWLQNNKPKVAPLPAVIIQECLIIYVAKQVDFIGKQILVKLMTDWKLMDELRVLRSIYLLGSGDLLHQFLIVIFDKLDKGDSLDDEFELNTILQESIRNSVDNTILGAPDSLSLSITKHDVPDSEDHASSFSSIPCKVRTCAFGIDALELMKLTYNVPWPLDLIINSQAIKKYNLVMNFLLKVKRAKFVLDKARRWMWKYKGGMTNNQKHHLLVQQKLLHFVDAFHQYVMDKVLHSSWLEICNGMTSAGSLDEVIDVHETYLLSIQKQCFVASDKLWILIATRVKTILGLALNFYIIQRTLSNGGATMAIKARCENEVNRIEKEFDECIAFLLRIMSFKLNVGHFPHLADLVNRINYNYFYMSDDGNLLTVPRF